MEPVNFTHFNFGARLNDYIHEIFHHGGVTRTEADLTDGQRAFLHAVRRELVKYADPLRKGYPSNQLEQLESFARTLGDLHNSYHDAGMNKIADCLFNRWKMVREEVKKLAAAGGADLPAWVDVIEVEASDMPAFFDA
ncbi:MAG: hypothetical protein HZA59_09235 [Hydrogenophilales bacterium]|nr:hypothetical protein [Hydrogenophilales bacterium]